MLKRYGLGIILAMLTHYISVGQASFSSYLSYCKNFSLFTVLNQMIIRKDFYLPKEKMGGMWTLLTG